MPFISRPDNGEFSNYGLDSTAPSGAGIINSDIGGGGAFIIYRLTDDNLVHGNLVEASGTNNDRVKKAAANSTTVIGSVHDFTAVSAGGVVRVATGGIGPVKLRAGQTPVRGAVLYASATAGEADVVAAPGTPAQRAGQIGICQDGTSAAGSTVAALIQPGAGSSQDNTTVANVGTGAGQVYRDKTVDQINLKTIKAGASVSVTNNADDVTIANGAPENTTVANVGTGAGQVYRDKTVDQINLKTIKAGASVSVTNNSDDVTIANSAPENTTVANVGGLTGQVYRDKTADQINLKTIGASTASDLTVTNNANDVTLGRQALYTLTDAATIAIDASLSNKFKVTLGGNRTLGNPTNPKADGQLMLIRVIQDGTGSRTLAYDTKYRFSSDLPSPTLSTGANKIDYLGFIYNTASDKWDFIAKVFGF